MAKVAGRLRDGRSGLGRLDLFGGLRSWLEDRTCPCGSARLPCPRQAETRYACAHTATGQTLQNGRGCDAAALFKARAAGG